jgi:hypothetical protein
MKIKIVLFLFIIYGCGKDSIPDPNPAVLLAPQNGDNCNTATSISFDQSRVDFSWIKSDNTDYYEVIAIGKSSNIKYKDTTSGIRFNGEVPETINKKLTLPKGGAYSWSVTSISNSTIVTTQSEIWEFYLEGNVIGDFLPQPANLIYPANEELISLANSDLIEFLWTSTDEDNNISGYDFYLGTSIDNLSKLGDKIPQTSFNQQLTLNTNYFWQVITIDLQGNNSASGINQFQTEP